jgi:hypothetical protein
MHFHPRGGFGASQVSVAGSVRVNLDRPSNVPDGHLAITAVGVDPATHDTWAAMGDALVHVDQDGNLIDSFYLAGPDGATLRATAIVVEPARLLIATESLGIFEFARPDASIDRSTLTVPPPPVSSPD